MQVSPLLFYVAYTCLFCAYYSLLTHAFKTGRYAEQSCYHHRGGEQSYLTVYDMMQQQQEEEAGAAALPDLDHLTVHDFRDIYEPSDDTFLLIDAIAADVEEIRAQRPRIVVEIG